MNRKFKLTSCSLILLSLLGVTSCQHEHVYDTEHWVHDNNEKYHWHNAICKHEGEVTDVEKHNFEGGERVNLPTNDYQIRTEENTCVVCGYTSKIISDTWNEQVVNLFKGTKSYQKAPNFEASLNIITKETKKVSFEDENSNQNSSSENIEDSTSQEEDVIEKEFVTVENFSVVRNENNFYEHVITNEVVSEKWVDLDTTFATKSVHNLNYILDGEQKTEQISNGDFKKFTIYNHAFTYLEQIVQLKFKQKYYDQNKLDSNGEPTLTYINLYEPYVYNEESKAYEINLESAIISKTGMREELKDFKFKAYFFQNILTGVDMSYIDVDDISKAIERTVDFSIRFNVADEVTQFVPYNFDK